MIASWPDTPAERARFERFRTTVQTRCTDVRFAWINGNLLVVGTVPAYAFKAEIESEATNFGFSIQNCVRVVPAGAARESYRMAG